MRAVERVLTEAGILFKADDYDMMRGPEYDQDNILVDITDQFIITAYFSEVLDPEIRLYDRKTFEFVGSQNLYPNSVGEMQFWNKFTRWDSYIAK